MCRVSPLERNFINDRKNWHNDSDFINAQEKLKVGDEAHKNGEYDIEGLRHRQVQEDIKRMGGVGKYDEKGRKAYGWNCLYQHHDSFIKRMNKNGYSFDDAFYYNDADRRYYLKEKAYKHADSNKYLFDRTGSTSIVNPNQKQQSREMGRSVSREMDRDVSREMDRDVSREMGRCVSREMYGGVTREMIINMLFPE